MDLDYNELFGIEAEDEGAEEQEVADPAADEETDEVEVEGEEEQEPAEPASVDDEDTDTQDSKPGRTEEDAKYAAARRRAEAERDRMVEQARREERERANDLIRRVGIRNPMKSGSNFETMEDLEVYEREVAQRKLQQGLRSGTATGEDIARSVMQSEAMKPIMDMRREMEQRRAAENQAAVQQRIRADVEAISKLDPDVKGIDDILNAPEYPQIIERVKRGDSLQDAYRLVYWDKLSTRQAQAAGQAARNRAAGKNHLQPTRSKGAGSVEVTQDVIEEYQRIMPDATPEEIRKYEAKYRKRK